MIDTTTFALAVCTAALFGWIAGARWSAWRMTRRIADLLRRPGPVTRDDRPQTQREREMHWRGAYTAVPVEDQIESRTLPCDRIGSAHAADIPPRPAVEAPAGDEHRTPVPGVREPARRPRGAKPATL